MRPLFVLIKCEMGRAYETAREAVDRIPEVSEIYSISGQYDLLGKFYLEPGQDPGLFVTEFVQRLPGVKDTFTLITFNAFSGNAASGNAASGNAVSGGASAAGAGGED